MHFFENKAKKSRALVFCENSHKWNEQANLSANPTNSVVSRVQATNFWRFPSHGELHEGRHFKIWPDPRAEPAPSGEIELTQSILR